MSDDDRLKAVLAELVAWANESGYVWNFVAWHRETHDVREWTTIPDDERRRFLEFLASRIGRVGQRFVPVSKKGRS